MKHIAGVAVAVCLVIVTPARAATPPAHRRPTAGTRSQLKAVRLRPARDSIRIVFAVQGPIRYVSRRTAQPARITIDLLQTTISPVLTHREILSEHPALIRILLARSAGSTRVILDLATAGSHSIYRAAASSQLVVDIKTMAGEAAARTVPPPPLVPPLPSVPIEPAASTVRPPSIEPELGRLATVRIPWVARRPDVDEFAAASTVPEGARVAGFRQREPADGSPVSEGTLAYLSYDNENLYAAFACKDEPGKIRSHLTPREDIGGDDQVSVYLDTFHDGRHAYVFASNPSGVQQDGIINEGQDPTYEIDTLWYSQGRRTHDGFVVLIAIPFKSIRFSGEPVQEWRIALGRTIARRGETAFWPYIRPRGQRFVPQLGSLEGLELISHGRNIQFMPYGTFKATESRDPGSLRAVRSDQRRAGFDTKVVVKNTVTIDAAVNPDFSEIESNDPQMLVNQRFEVLIPEKRPFFTENAAMFATPINVFFSRRIVDPEFGVKVTARSTKWAIAGLSANDRAVAAPDADGVFGRTAKVGAARIERNFGDRSKLAVLSTERQVGLGSNAVVSVDGRTNLSALWTISGQVVRSTDVDQSGGRVNGAAYFAGIARNGRHFTYLGRRRLATCRASTCARPSSTRATCGNRTIPASGASDRASAPWSIGIGRAVCRTGGRPRNCRCPWRARLKSSPHGTKRSSFTPAFRFRPGRRACRYRAPLLPGCRCGRRIREARASTIPRPLVWRRFSGIQRRYTRGWGSGSRLDCGSSKAIFRNVLTRCRTCRPAERRWRSARSSYSGKQTFR